MITNGDAARHFASLPADEPAKISVFNGDSQFEMPLVREAEEPKEPKELKSEGFFAKWFGDKNG